MFFKILGQAFVAGMMVRPRGKLGISHRLEHTAERAFVDGDAVFLIDPKRQILETPAHDTVNRRDWPALDKAAQLLSLPGIQYRSFSGCLAVHKTGGSLGIEPNNPVPDDLRRHRSNRCRLFARGAVINRGQRQQTPCLCGILGRSSKLTQIGGGIRDIKTAEELLDTGVNRVILGTAALKEPDIIGELSREFGPSRVMVSIDSAGGEVVGKGWKEGSGKTPLIMGGLFQGKGAGSLLYTDVDREGRLENADTSTLSKLVDSLEIPVVFAGGITTVNDVEKVKKAGASGVVIGSAIYAKKISLPDVLELQED